MCSGTGADEALIDVLLAGIRISGIGSLRTKVRASHDHLCRNVGTWSHDAITELLLTIADNALDLGVHVAKVDSSSPVEFQ